MENYLILNEYKMENFPLKINQFQIYNVIWIKRQIRNTKG